MNSQGGPAQEVSARTTPSWRGGHIRPSVASAPWFPSLRVWALPFVLSLLPLVFLWFAGGEEREKREDRIQKEWGPRSAELARRLREASDPAFWAGRTLVTLKRRLEREARADPQGFRFGPSLERILARPVFAKVPRSRVWAVTFPGGDPEGRPDLVRSRFCETEAGFFIRSLLAETVKRACRRPSELGSARWDQRLASLFGVTVTSEFFDREFRGKTLIGIFARSHVYLAWEIVVVDRRPIGAILVAMPFRPDWDWLGVRATLANWKVPDVYPAFLSFPVDPGFARVRRTIHPALRDPVAQRIIGEVQQRMVIFPGGSGPDAQARVRLPVDLADRPLLREGWRYRVFPLAQECGFLGIVMSRVPRERASGEDLVLACAIAGWAIGWAWFALSAWWTGRWFTFPVRTELVLWFLAMIAVPVLFGGVTIRQYLDERGRNLEDGARRTLSRTLQSLEDESGILISQQEFACRRTLDLPSLLPDLKAVQMQRGDGRALMDAIWQRGIREGLPLTGLRIHGPKDWVLARDDSENLSQVSFMTTRLTYLFAKKALKKAVGSPAGFPEPPPENRIKPTVMEDFLENMVIKSEEEHLTQLSLGTGGFFNFNRVLRDAEGDWYLLFLVWEMEPVYRRFLELRVPRIRSPLEGLEVGAFYLEKGRMQDAGYQGDLAHLRRLARKSADRQYSGTSGSGSEEFLNVGFPSRRISGFILTARAPTWRIRWQLRLEGSLLFGLLGGTLALVILTATALARWLADPIAAMSGTLQRIASGNLDAAAGLDRNDELGEAGRTVDRMVQSLRERRTLTRFVAPQVLEAVAGGDAGILRQGQSREVAMLVCDIRSFTTLSETHPPGVLFAALNEHLQEMTAVLGEFGGVVDRFIGDAIVAAFYPGGGAPWSCAIRAPGAHSPPRGGRVRQDCALVAQRPPARIRDARNPPAVRAAQAAVAMHSAHARMMTVRRQAGDFPFEIGVGIDVGRVVTGILGDEEVRLDFTVLGEPVARATALESLSRHGTVSRIFVSPAAAREIGRTYRTIPVPGHEGALELIGPDPAAEGVSLDQPEGGPEGGAPGTATEGEEVRNPLVASPTAFPSPGSDGAGASGGFPRGLLLMLGILPILLAVGGFGILWNGVADLGEKALDRELEQDCRLLEQLQEPSRQLTFLLHSRAFRAMQEMDPSGDFGSETVRMATRTLQDLEGDLPSLNWGAFGFPIPPSSGTFRIASLSLTTGGSSRHDWQDTRLGSWNGPTEVRPDAAGGLVIHDATRGFTTGGDSLFFRYQRSFPEGSIGVRVTQEDPADSRSIGGLMLRESLDPQAPFVLVGLAGDGLVYLIQRERPGDEANWIPFWTNGLKAVSMKIEVASGRRTLILSEDGQAWHRLFDLEFSWQPEVVGVAVSSSVNGQTVTGEPTRILRVGSQGNPRVGAEDSRMLATFAKFGVIDVLSRWQALSRTAFSWFMEARTRLIPEESQIFRVLATTFSDIVQVTFREFVHWHLTIPVFRSWVGKDRSFVEEMASMGWGQASPQDLVWRVPLEFQQNLGALLLVSLLPEDLHPDRWLRHLAREFERRGSHLVIFPGNDGSRPLWTSSVFREDPVLARFLAQGSVSAEREGGWVIREIRMEGGCGWRVWAARSVAMEETGGREIVLRRLWLPGILLVFFLAFLAIRGRNLFSRPLRDQMVTGFLLALLPVLLQGIIFLELLGSEEEARVRVERTGALESSLERVEAGYALFNSWLYALLSREAERPELRQALKTGKVGEVVQEKGLQGALRTGFHRLWQHGFPHRELGFLEKNGPWVRYPPLRATGQTRILSDILGENSFSTYERLIGESREFRTEGERNRRLIMASQVDEVRRFLLFTAGLQKCNALLLRPGFLGEWLVGKGSKDFYFRRTLWIDGKPAGELNLTFDQPTFHHHLFAGWNGEEGEPPPDGVSLHPVDPTLPMFLLVPPYYRYELDPFDRGIAFHPILRSAPREAASLVHAVRDLNSPLMKSEGRGQEETLVLVAPATRSGGWFYLAETPLGRILERLHARTSWERILLVGFTILGVVISLLVAGRFLKPCEEFMGGIGAVLQGNFSVRLSPDWGAEWGGLARAFNQMAGEIQEGKLLGRFVSGSVLEIARTRGSAGGLEAPEQREVVILFAALPGFSRLLQKTDPGVLIENLNLYLRAQSAIISRHGGEIDKFIGDRILAVFTPEPGAPVASVIGPALAAAREMHAAMGRGPETLPRTIGIGLTLGPVLAGVLGTEAIRQEFTVIGDTVNLASRLADLACLEGRGGLIVDSHLVTLAEERLPAGKCPRFRRLEVSRVKGKTREVSIFGVDQDGENL